jgi:hypothetical protein
VKWALRLIQPFSKRVSPFHFSHAMSNMPLLKRWVCVCAMIWFTQNGARPSSARSTAFWMVSKKLSMGCVGSKGSARFLLLSFKSFCVMPPYVSNRNTIISLADTFANATTSSSSPWR